MNMRVGTALVRYGIWFVITGLTFACSSSDEKASEGTGGTGVGGTSTGTTGTRTTSTGTTSTGGTANQGGEGTGGSKTTSTVAVSPSAVVGSFSLRLNPAVEDQPAYDQIIGTNYAWEFPTDVTETVKIKNADCAVYTFGLQFCDPTCASGEEVCIGNNTCRAKPEQVSVGDVTIEGVGDTTLKLKNANNTYQYVGAITYPGFNAGDAIQLSATGDFYPAFSVEAKGVEPIALTKTSYEMSAKSDLVIEWTPSPANASEPIEVLLNISKHGGSYGYLKCAVADTGKLTIPADQIAALMKLGVSGFPSLLVTRSSIGKATLEKGVITFDVTSIAKPALNIEGYCSCFDSSECGSCSDSTKTACNTTTKLCYAP
jgi:hypothetical protein